MHAFAEGVPLWLGGVLIPYPRGLAGHSDGDAAIHALIDALLGATGRGDIGEWFPSTDERWRNVRSAQMLRARLVRPCSPTSWSIENIDITLVCRGAEAGAARLAMRQALASVLGCHAESVSLKATTTDGLGALGRAEGVLALASVLLEKGLTLESRRMGVRVYSTLTGQEQELVPLSNDGVVRFYVCGMTPKFHPHIGHGRTFVSHGRHPPLSRLSRLHGEVRPELHGRRRQDHPARRAEGRAAEAAARAYIDSYFEVMDRLNVRRADDYPSVTGYMERIVEFVAGLVEADHAYAADGDVWFSVAAFPEYGKLSRRDLEQPAGGGAQGARARQARPARLRAVESRQGGRAILAQPVGARSTRLAHRVLGHGARDARRSDRSPRRRRRSDLSAP